MGLKWARPLKPIVIEDARIIDSPAEARDFIASLPFETRASGPWAYASELLLPAAHSNEKYATMQAREALKVSVTVRTIPRGRVKPPRASDLPEPTEIGQ